MTHEQQFHKAREAWIKARGRYLELVAQAEAKHQAPWYIYAPRGLQAKINAAQDRESAKSNAFFAILDTVSKRNWHNTVPAFWTLEKLTWRDAITRGPLSVVPPPAYGYSPQAVQAFARALPGYGEAA